MSAKLLAVIGKLLPMKKGAEIIVAFFGRLFLFEEIKDRENIENLRRYLTATKEILEQMKDNGASPDEVLRTAKKLHLPVARAVMMALTARYKANEGSRNDQKEAS